MNGTEQALSVECSGESLLGILHLPLAPRDLGVIVIVGGPQYRAGSHRQFVLLARALADAGHAVLRLDVRGMGDSTGSPRDFEGVSTELRAAIDALLAAVPGLQRVALWGLCDGASAALLYLYERSDPRVAGLCLLNPWVRSATSLAKTQVKHYYRQRLMERAFWSKLVSGQVALGAVAGLARALRSTFATPSQIEGDATSYQQRMLAALVAFAGPVLLLLSEQDYTAREFEEFTTADAAWRAALGAGRCERVALAGADHTCSQMAARRAAEAATVAWLARHSRAMA
jgi:exosortase A-associated hydrolase 1